MPTKTLVNECLHSLFTPKEHQGPVTTDQKNTITLFGASNIFFVTHVLDILMHVSMEIVTPL